MDSKNFVYVPRWVKTVALLVLVLALFISLLISYQYIGRGNKEDWILAGLSLGQIAASGIVISLVVFFSEKDVNSTGLQKRSEAFFYKTFPRACSLIDYPRADFEPWEEKSVNDASIKSVPRHSNTQIRIMHNPGEIDAYYEITAFASKLVIRIQVNISEVVISYYIPARDEQEKDAIQHKLAWAFSRYTQVSGYTAGDWYFSRENFDGNHYASLHLTQDFGPDFLEDERKKLFVANDIAASTRGILKECVQKEVRTAYT